MAGWLGGPFVAAGLIKLAYDALLHLRFRDARPPEERPWSTPIRSSPRG